jgi:hypothetical protein
MDSEEGMTWYRFAVSGTVDPGDPFIRFIAIWISFNAWYEENLPGEREWRQIDAIAESADLVAAHAALLSSQAIDYRDAIEMLRSSGVSNVRNGRLRTIDSPNDLKSVLQCVYQIRCNLFHGGKHREDDRDRQLSKSGFTIIAGLLNYTMEGTFPSLDLL